MHREGVHHRLAGRIQADDLDLRAGLAELHDDLVQGSDGGDVPEVRVRDIDADPFSTSRGSKAATNASLDAKKTCPVTV